MPASNALHSLYGKGHVKAGGAKRKQTIITPPCIIEALHKMWPEGIALDPCAPPGNVGDPCAVGCKWWDGANGDGLAEPWAERTYCNPPYGELKKWMVKSASERVEHVMLVPLRPHRQWFQFWRYDAVAFLKPLKFVGFDQAFPVPLCVLYKGGTWGRPDGIQAFADAFRHLSTQVIMPGLSHLQDSRMLERT